MKKASSNTLARGAALACLLGLAHGALAGGGQPMAPLFDNLGSYHRQVSTGQPAAQRFFDQGMTLFYGFEWNESVRSFREAARLDPDCAPCHWAVALSLAHRIGPLDGREYADGRAAIEKARLLKGRATPAEADLIDALLLRYRRMPMPAAKAGGGPGCHPSEDLDRAVRREKAAYASAMKKLVARHAQDVDIKALYAAAIFWGNPNPKPTARDPGIRAATAALADGIKKDPSHAGAHHYFIHLVEAHGHPEIALDSARALETLVPGAEHLVHMPSHIYLLTGRYEQATASNIRAVAAFRQYEKETRAQGFEPEVNYLNFHDQDFLRTSAAMEGRRELATGSASGITDAPFPAWLENQAALQWFIPIAMFEQIRFAGWNAVLATPMPEAKYAYATGMWHYAQGMAQVPAGTLARAAEHADALRAIISGGERDSVLGQDGHTLLTIAQAVLQARIADSRGEREAVFASLGKAMALQDGMRYHEPPDWYFPVTQAMGDAYLKWGEPARAKRMYERTLRKFPENGWSLFGLARSLEALGRPAEAARAEERFRAAWKNADIPAPVSFLSR
jgi:tetratricopeptide (TPR) repeat protein